jgi:DNA invertase Pin-like site-specific DNA recombinase
VQYNVGVFYAGLAAAKARGRIGGRPKKLDKRKIALAKSMIADTSNSIKDVCKMLEVSRATLYQYLKE